MIRPWFRQAGGTVKDNSHPEQSIWENRSLHQTRGGSNGCGRGVLATAIATELDSRSCRGFEVVRRVAGVLWVLGYTAGRIWDTARRLAGV